MREGDRFAWSYLIYARTSSGRLRNRLVALDSVLNKPWTDGWHIHFEQNGPHAGFLTIRIQAYPTARIWARRYQWKAGFYGNTFRPKSLTRKEKSKANHRKSVTLPFQRTVRDIGIDLVRSYEARLEAFLVEPTVDVMDGVTCVAVRYLNNEAERLSFPNQNNPNLLAFLWEIAFGECFVD